MLDLLNWAGDVAPGHSRDASGELLLGGQRATDLAKLYGTPLLALDLDVFDASVAEFAAACAPHGIELAYAGKALLFTALAHRLAESGLHLDVCSLGEITTAERAGFPAERMTLHGCGKPDEELDAVASGRVGTVVADSVDELERLAQRTLLGRPAQVVVRVNTGIEARTHEFVRTAGDNTKFGVAERDYGAAIETFGRAKNLRFVGLHSHIGSQVFDAGAFVANTSALFEVAGRFAKGGCASRKLIVGGGFGVQDLPGNGSSVPVRETIDAIAAAADRAARSLDIPKPQLAIEPGRALIARAGTSIYRVMARKRQHHRTFLVVDGSLADNPRPALYRAYSHLATATPHSGSPSEVTVCGRSCENDEMGPAQVPANVCAGDIVAMCVTGAYTYSMAGNYNRFAKPAVVALQGGTHRLFARRQTLDDVLHEDIDA
jgi:diaminopimelate decarboxylase